jgi:hypothetical protein
LPTYFLQRNMEAESKTHSLVMWRIRHVVRNTLRMDTFRLQKWFVCGRS